jgi:predicted dehydrogenase
MSKFDELHIGVIGAGGRGGLAALAHRPEEGARLVAGCDIVPAVLEKFRETYGPDTFVTEDYRELLARPDIGAVFVCSPDFWHEEHAVAALEAGKDVYCEKPMAITIAGCDRMLETACRNNRKLFLGHNMRHFGVVLQMKELIEQGAIGEVRAGWCRHFVCYGGEAYFKDWHAEQSKATSLLLQKGAHDIDVLHWLCGGYSRRVVGMGALTLYDKIADKHDPAERGDASWYGTWPPMAHTGMNPVIDVEDISMMLMHLDNGVFCSYQQCHYTPDGWRNYTIIGTEGRIENFGDGPGDAVVRLWNARSYHKPEGDAQFPIPSDTGSHGGADPKIVAEFVRYVREGGKINTSPIAARYSVAAGCLAADSLRHGAAPREVPPVPEEIAEYFNRDLKERVTAGV